MHYYTDVLKKYVEFDGRASRKEYWMFTFMNTLVYVVVSFVAGAVLPQSLGGVVTGLYALAILLPSIAVGIRRLHDTNRSGWWLLIGIIPFIGALVLLVFFVLDSTPGANEYGPNPKGMMAAAPTGASATPPQQM
jgi:uncharacterized membrane protein YhaH (DUF805 family)